MADLLAPYAGDDFQLWLVNPVDGLEQASKWVNQAGITDPVVLDSEKDVYDLYFRYPGETYAPYPVHVVIGKDGVVRYLAFQYDAQSLTAVIEAALAE